MRTVDALMIMMMTAMTTNGGPHGHVQDARNLSSLKGRPWRSQARRNRQLASPIETQAICHVVHHWMTDALIHSGEAHLVRHANNVLQPSPQLAAADEAGAEAQNADAACCQQRV